MLAADATVTMVRRKEKKVKRTFLNYKAILNF